ncbi:hypothetical protein [Aquabacterium sp. OR-4]|uniref:hypothetical protein n=1 Tax=Aquabacterium sp. OR-4 TaxID=2978127 RepID=UPI0021B3E8C2|nr:hypothetical protein [Aquabacterium sp. OR-4]MDT7833597.1 hypothetical protein [Aquabacterium sp. OR-4]
MTSAIFGSAAFGWLLALAALLAGWFTYGWPGVALAFSVIVFWLLLQFSRAMRAMRQATGAPVGEVASAVMLNARLRQGLRLMDIIGMTRSLGEKLADTPESFRWRDAGGSSVTVELRAGRCVRWTLHRPEVPEAPEAPAANTPAGAA